jgi:NAD(P)-dependent dehydrogenase (short-subunit alcohol dehydrogenase family)
MEAVMDFKNKTVVVTGGASGIGKTICDEFKKYGANVCVIDKQENNYFTGDIADENTLRLFAHKVIDDYNSIDYLINNAMLSKGGIFDCSYDDFNYVLRVGVTAPFMLSKLFMNHFNQGGCIVNISSTRAYMSQPNTESYTSAKGAISALTHSLAISLSGRVRVNSISPGWIDTNFTVYEGPDANQHPVKRVGNPLDIANMVLYLCSDKAGFITGQDFCIDGGMTKQMIYHNDFGWTYG